MGVKNNRSLTLFKVKMFPCLYQLCFSALTTNKQHKQKNRHTHISNPSVNCLLLLKLLNSLEAFSAIQPAKNLLKQK